MFHSSILRSSFVLRSFCSQYFTFSLPCLLAGSVSSANILREESVKIIEKRNRAFASKILEKFERWQEMDPGIDIMLLRSAWGKFCFTLAGGKRKMALWVPRAPRREERLSRVNINTVDRNSCLTYLADLSKGGLAKYFHILNMAQIVAGNPPRVMWKDKVGVSDVHGMNRRSITGGCSLVLLYWILETKV